MSNLIKLQKILVEAGLGSRRFCDNLIAEGSVTVNGETATLGQRVNLSDEVKYNGAIVSTSVISEEKETVVLAYHKPAGEICSTKSEGKAKSVFDRLPPLTSGRWISVGRLDINTSGLILFTNNGELANKLMHPSYEIEREYLVRVLGDIDGKTISKLTKGLTIEGQKLKFEKVLAHDIDKRSANNWYKVILRSGKYREVRRLWEAVGTKVSRLMRIRYGQVALPKSMKPGEYAFLKPNIVKKLLS